METGIEIEEPKFYVASGGKHSFHGVTYQLKLLMLFIIRAMNVGYRTFSLATEMEDAGKLDDIIFSYPKSEDDPEEGRYYRFLQAKHTISDTTKKIGATDLLNETGGNYSLAKYFQSFLKISRNKKLIRECDEIKDLIICTNMSFKFEDSCRSLTLKDSVFESVKNEAGETLSDNILSTELLRFKDDFDGRNEIVTILKNSVIRFPKRFAECVLGGKEYIHEESEEKIENWMYRSYESALVNEVLDVDKRRFRTEFSDWANLSPAAKHFHEALECEMRKSGVDPESQEGEMLWKTMKEKELKLSGSIIQSPCFIEQPEKVSKKFSDLVRRNMDSKKIQVQKDKSVMARNIKILVKNVMHMKDGVFYLNGEFLNDEDMPGNLNDFRMQLKRQLAFFNIEFSELEKFRFEISEYWQGQVKMNEVSIMEENIEKFLKKLVFAVNQPNEAALDEVIIGEIKRRFNETDAKYVYRSFLESTLNWMKEKQGRYYSHEDAQKLFEMLKKEILRLVLFELKDPVCNFIGREKELVALKEEFDKSREKCCKTVISQSAAISGLGGIGKSELARKYAQKHRADYDNIVWINCESSETMVSSFLRLAFDRLGIPKKNVNGEEKKVESIVEEVYVYFCGKTNLFIFDNANYLRSSTEQDDGILRYLPISSGMREFHILITSRNQNWGSINVLSLENFTEMEALEFLRNSLGHIVGFNEKEASLLVSQLNHFPLALQQAASYIRENHRTLLAVGESFSVADYLKLLEKSCSDLLDYEFPMDCNDSYSRTTFSTWSITLRHIEMLKYGGTAINVLNLISYLAPDSIDVNWVSSALNVTCKIEMGSAVELLKQYSMISVKERRMSVHRLVQLVTRFKLNENGREMEVLKTILKSAKSLEVDHCITAWNYVSKYGDLVCEFNDIPHFIADVLLGIFKYKLALSFCESCCVTLEKHLDGTHPSVLNAKLDLGKGLHYEGKHKESLKLYKYVLEIQRKSLGDSDRRTLLTMNQIAMALMELGECENSLVISMEIMEKGGNIFHPADDMMITTGHNIANAFSRLGDYERSLKYFEDIYGTEKLTLGDDHPTTLTTRHNMAIVLMNLDRYDEATCILNDICDKYKASKREDDPDLMSVMNSFSLLLKKQNKLDKALKQNEKVLEMFNNKFGEQHPFTLRSKGDLALVLFDLGKVEEGINMLTEVCNSLKSILGYDHEYSLSSLSYLANLYRSLGNYKESLGINKEVYAARKRIHGEDNVLTLYSKNDMAVNLCFLGMEKKSLAMLESIYKKIVGIFDDRNLAAIKIKHNIAVVLKQQKKYEQSRKTFQEVYELRKIIFGENHPFTLETKKFMTLFLNSKFDPLKDEHFWYFS